MIPRMSVLAQNTQVDSTMDAYVHIGGLGAVFDGLDFRKVQWIKGLSAPTAFHPYINRENRS
jgi:hypothetical protein